MTAHVCGLDIGSTNIKVVLLDVTGEVIWSRARPTPRGRDAHGAVTDPRRLVAELESMIIEGWRAVGAGKALKAICTAGVGEDGIRVDADHAPLDRSIPWFDTRADRQAGGLRDQWPTGAFTGCPIDATRTVAKWRWLQEEASGGADRTALWLALTDFPLIAWSGNAFMSETLAARTGAYDVLRRRWNDDVLALSAAPPLPAVVRPGTVQGGVIGGALREAGAADDRTCVVVGGHDHPTAAAAIRRVAPDAIVDSLGTAELIYSELPEHAPALRSDPTVTADSPIAFSVPGGGDDGVACLGVIEHTDVLHRVEQQLGVPALERLLGTAHWEGPPIEPAVLPDELASPAALDASHAADARMRQALEAFAYGARRVLEREHALGAPAGPLYATGGWSRSDAFLQLRANVFQCPIHRMEVDELTATGAALLALQGIGEDGSEALTRRAVDVIHPGAKWATSYDSVYTALCADSSRRCG